MVAMAQAETGVMQPSFSDLKGWAQDDHAALFIGHYEPELNGAVNPSEKLRSPIYRMPPEARGVRQWRDRQDLMESGALENRSLEIALVDDEIEAFFLQVQGSGRSNLLDGSASRIGYAGKNGHPYRSIGQELVRKGVFHPQQVSAQTNKTWFRQNPEAGRSVGHVRDCGGLILMLPAKREDSDSMDQQT